MNPPPRSTDLAALLESRDFVRKLARSLVGDPERAEDLAQEAWVRALERPPGRVGAMKGWLAHVLRNLAVNQGLREAQRPAVERQAARPQALEEEERDLELEGVVLDSVRSLKQPYRSAIYLRYYRSLSPGEIAAELGVPEATVKTRLRRGLELLRTDLDRHHDGDRKLWCNALVAFALPELLIPTAAPIPLAALAKGAFKGILVMNKPVTATLTAIALVAIASVAVMRSRGGDAPEQDSQGRGALAPELAAEPALEPAPTPEEPAPTRAAPARADAQRAVASVPATTASASSGLKGRVVDAAGNPLAGAEVRGVARESDTLFIGIELAGVDLEDDAAATTSAADGSFHLPAEEDGPMELIVRAAGFAPFRKEVTGYFDLITDVGELVLQPGVVLAGRVVTADGQPVAGAQLRTTANAQSGNVIPFMGALQPVAAVTDADGRFALDSHAVGQWSLEARTTDYPPALVDGVTEAPGQQVLDIEIVLDAGSTIAGRIEGVPADRMGELWVRASRVLESPGFSSGGFRVVTSGGDASATERVARVDADGRFLLVGLSTGTEYRLRAYDVEGERGGRARSRATEAMTGETEVALTWAPGASVAFQVIDAETERPVEVFSVTSGFDFPTPLMGANGRLREHPDGQVLIEDLRVSEGRESANATVEIVADGYEPWSSSEVTVPRDAQADLGVIRLEPVPLVLVTVVDRAGAPVAGARVSLVEESVSTGDEGGFGVRRRVAVRGRGGPTIAETEGGREALTDEDGVARISSLPGRRASISVDARRFADFESDAFDLPALGDLERTVQLARGGVAAVQVLDEAGEPLPGARVEQRPQDLNGHDALVLAMHSGGRVTDSEGRVYFRNLTEGTHEFRLVEDSGGTFVMNTDGGGRMAVGGMRLAGGAEERPWTELWIEDGATEELVLSKASVGTLAGIITEDGAPLADAELSLVVDPDDPMARLSGFADAPGARTNSRGEYTVEGVQPGTYTLMVRHETRALPHREELELLGGRDLFDLDLDVAILSGRVQDASGDPVVGARVEVERVREASSSGRPMLMFATRTVSDDVGGGSSSSVTLHSGGPRTEPVETDADGIYVLRGVPTNTKLRVTAKAEELSPAQSEVVELAPSEKRSDLDLEMRQGAAVVVTLTKAGAPPAANVIITAQRLEADESVGEPVMQIADGDGRATFEDLEPGRWRFTPRTIGAPGSTAASPDPVEVTVEGGDELPVTIEMP